MTQSNYAKVTLSDQEGKATELSLLEGTMGPSVIDIRKLYADTGRFTYDPGYTSTASCTSKITYIDGEEGVLLHRGYPIEELATKSDFLEVAYLIMFGELPTAAQKAKFVHDVTYHTMVHEQILLLFRGFRRDAHPMAVMIAVVGALSAFYHEDLDIQDPHNRMIASYRLVAKVPTIAAMAYKYSVGQPFMYPRNDLTYAENFLHMMFGVPCEPYKPNPVLAKALDRIFILHADHEQNASTSTVRLVGSTGASPYAAIAAGIASLWGPGAWRRQRGGGQHAVRDRLGRAHPGVPRARQGPQRPVPPDGLRPSRLQELRSARRGAARERARGAGRARPRRRSAAADRRGAREDRARTTTTSSSASCSRTSISIPASSCRRWASRPRCSPRSSRWRARSAGSRSGAR